MRFWRQATSALLLLAVLALAAAAVLYVTKDWLVALGVRVGIAEYDAHMNSTMSVQDVALDLLTLTATVRGVSIAQHGQTLREAPIYVAQASAKVRLWPLLRRQVVLDEVAVSGVRVRLQVDAQARVNLAELFRPVEADPHRPSRWNVIIHHFTVDPAMVDLAFEGQALRASLDQMAFQGAFTAQPLHVHADMLRGQGDVTYLRRQDRLRYHLSRTAATVDVYRKRLAIDRLRVDAGEFTVRAHGGIDNAQVAGQFDIDVDLAAVAALIPEAPSPAGAFSLHGTLAGPLHQPRLQLAAEAEGVELGPYVASKLSAEVNLTGRRLQLERFGLGFAGGTIQGLGTLDLASEHVDIEVDVAGVALAGLEPLAAHATALVDGHVAGRMRLVSPSFNREHMRVAGKLALSPPGPTQVATRAQPLLPLPLALTATFHFEHRTLTLEQAAWTLDGARGRLAGTLALDGGLQVAGDVAADLAAQTFVRLGWPSARGEAKFAFEVGGTLPEPRVKADLQLRQARYRDIPIESFALALEAEGSTVKIVSLAGAQWGGRYRVTGAIELSTPLRSLPVDASALPIRSISGLQVSVERLNLAKLALLLPTPVPLAGELTLHAKGAGPWSSLRGTGQIEVRGLMVRGEALGDVSLALEGAPTHVTLTRLLAGVGGGQLSAQGSVALPRPFVEVTMAWQGVQLDRLTALQGMDLPLSGGLNGAAKLRGLWPDLQAGVTVHGPRLVVSGLDVADLHLQATASAREILLERLTTRIAGARFEAGGRVAFHGPIDIRLSSESIPLRGLVWLPKGLPWRGRVQLRLTGSGSVETPQLRGHIELMGVQAGGMAIGTGTVRLALDGRQLTFATAGLQTVDLDGAVTLDETLATRVRLGVRALDVGLASAWLGGVAGAIAGEVSGTLEVNGPLRVLPSMSGRVTVDRLRLRSNGVELQNTGPLRWQLAGGVLQFESVRLQAQGASLDMRGRIDLGQETLDIAISGTSPLAAAGARLPGIRFQQGMVHTQMQMRGRLRDPIFEGQALIQDGALYIAAINEHLSQLKGEIQFAKQGIAIPSLTGQFAGGTIAVSGEARLQRFQLHDISLTAEVTRARLRYPTGFFTAFDAELVATGTSQRQLVTGEVRLGQARYRQELDVAWFMRQFRQRALEPPPKAEESLQFDIRVHTRDPLRVENRLAKLQLATDLNVRGTPSRPVVLGRVDIEKGSADVGGSRFTNVSGSIDFLNPSRTEPFIDIAADTQKGGYQIHVMATGTPQHLDLRLTSEPALAEPDILALLTAGATGQAIAAGVGTVLPPRLSAFLTGQIAEEIGRGIVGIDRLDIEPVVGGAQRVGGPKVTVGKEVSKNLSVTYSTVVGSTLEDLVTVEYRITDNISLLGVRDERGDVGVDVKFSLRFE